MKTNKVIIYSFLLAFTLWFLPFILSFCVKIEISQMDILQLKNLPQRENSAMQETVNLLSIGDKWGAFVNIFINNLSGCIFNIIGGVLLGLGTTINLIYNGFVLGGIVSTVYASEKSVSFILRATLPHSFELIGIWLSGAIGFCLAWQIICYIRGKENFTQQFLKQIGIYSAIVLLITLLAAYVEAYITIDQI